jgi:hypothetical protein
LESLRAGRTRYLVVVSRPLLKNTQQSSLNRQKINLIRNQSIFHTKSASHSKIDEISNKNVNETDSSISITSTKKIPTDDSCFVYYDQLIRQGKSCEMGSIKNLAQYSTSDQFCENESILESSYCCKVSSNDIEESCLLGIDCNEKTTVGMVLKILADTAIRLDGDG